MATILSSRYADHPQHVVEIIVKLWQAARIKDKATSSKQASKQAARTRIKDKGASKQGSSNKDKATRIKDQGSRIKQASKQG